MNTWKCAECGYTLSAPLPPETCPSCLKKCEFLNATCYTPECASDNMDTRIGETPEDPLA